MQVRKSLDENSCLYYKWRSLPDEGEFGPEQLKQFVHGIKPNAAVVV